MIAVLPWLFGCIGLAIGYSFVGDAAWLVPFAAAPVVVGFVVIWPRAW